MLLLAISTQSFRRAATFAERAFHVYPKHHDRIPALAHDFGLLCVRASAFSLAYHLLRRVVNLIIRPHERLIVWSTLALSAAGAEEGTAYAEARSVVLDLVSAFPSNAPPALMNLAFAAHIRGEWNDAARWAERAMVLGESNPLYKEQTRDATLLLDRVLRRESAGRERELPRLSAEYGAALRNLHDSLVRRLSTWHGPTWRKRREQATPGAFGSA